MTKTVIIGLDGLDLGFVKEWRDELPTLSKFMEEGFYGVLKSTIPPITVPAWPSMFTGKNPGNLGCFHSLKVVKEKRGYSSAPVNTKKWKDDLVWSLLSNKGKKSLVIDVPGTNVSKGMKGVFIGGITNLEEFYPREIVKELESNIENFQDLRTDEYTSKPVKGKIKHSKIKLRILKYINEKYNPELSFIVLQPTDTVMHFSNKKSRIKEVYKKVDGMLEDVLATFNDRKTNILIVSDHGSKRWKNKIYINTWLKKKGFLSKKTKEGPSLKDKIYKSLNKIFGTFPGLKYPLRKFKDMLEAITGKKIKKVSKERILNNIDFGNTKAFDFVLAASNYSGIWLLDKKIEEKLLRELKEMKDPESGEKIVKNIYRSEEVHGHNKKEQIPDLIIEFKNCVVECTDWGTVFRKYNDFLHRRKGTIMGKGPDFKTREIEETDIYDVAPTILHLQGLPVPKEMNGEVRKEIFEESSNPTKKRIKYVESEYYKNDLRGVKV